MDNLLGRVISLLTCGALRGTELPMEFPPTDPSRVRLLRIDVRSDTPVDVHPDVAPLLHAGWAIKHAAPRLVEGEGLQWFVVLTRADDVNDDSSPVE